MSILPTTGPNLKPCPVMKGLIKNNHFGMGSPENPAPIIILGWFGCLSRNGSLSGYRITCTCTCCYLYTLTVYVVMQVSYMAGSENTTPLKWPLINWDTDLYV